jgi:hypothetical protein
MPKVRSQARRSSGIGPDLFANGGSQATAWFAQVQAPLDNTGAVSVVVTSGVPQVSDGEIDPAGLPACQGVPKP